MVLGMRHKLQCSRRSQVAPMPCSIKLLNKNANFLIEGLVAQFATLPDRAFSGMIGHINRSM